MGGLKFSPEWENIHQEKFLREEFFRGGKTPRTKVSLSDSFLEISLMGNIQS
jgi:hypothetical protein